MYALDAIIYLGKDGSEGPCVGWGVVETECIKKSGLVPCVCRRETTAAHLFRIPTRSYTHSFHSTLEFDRLPVVGLPCHP